MFVCRLKIQQLLIRLPISLAVCALVACVLTSTAQAERREKVKSSNAPKTAFSRLSIFDKGFNTKNVVSIVDLSETKKVEKPKVEQSEAELAAKTEKEKFKERARLRYVSNRPSDDDILPPEETPSIRVNPEAPSSIRALISAKRTGDTGLAKAYADQFVRYQQNYFFEVQEIVDLIGEALVRQSVINEEEWVGVGQAIDFEMAKTRYELGSIIKPTHEVAMKQVVADSNNKAEIYYFFGLSCSWCRYMAPDVERMWRLSQQDPNINMHVFTISSSSVDWLNEYKKYNEWTMPVYDGTEIAKQWNIGYVPAVVIVAPTSNKAYMKTGQQSFERLYEFTRAVQGAPATVTKEFQDLASTPIGEAEKASANTIVVRKGKKSGKARLVARPPKKKKLEIQRF